MAILGLFDLSHFFNSSDKSYEMNSTHRLRQHREEAAYQNVPKKKVCPVLYIQIAPGE